VPNDEGLLKPGMPVDAIIDAGATASPLAVPPKRPVPWLTWP